MYSSAGLGTDGGIRRSPEGSELGGDIEKYKKLFFQIFVNFCYLKYTKRAKQPMSRVTWASLIGQIRST